jgi:ribonuclease P protein component
MLNLKNRIRLTNDFKDILKNGRSFFCKDLYIKTKDNKLDNSRFGIIISTKVSKKAVQRNHLKRIIREIIKENLSNIKNKQDVVIVLSSSISTKNKEEISDIILRGLGELRLLDKLKK